MEVYVPIRDKESLVGIFAFGRKESGEPYSTQDLDVLMTVANQTTVVLQNARLVSDLRTANRSIIAAQRGADRIEPPAGETRQSQDRFHRDCLA